MRREWIVIGLVAAGVLGVELTLRALQDTLSGDIAHLNQADEVVEALHDAPGIRVLFLGNSLLPAGIDPVELESRLEEELEADVSLALVNPDGTGPLQWNYLARKLVFHPGLTPDLMVVPFGPGHLRDQPLEEQLLPLAAHHVDGQDATVVLREELSGIETRSQFALARVSTAFALRDRIAPRVFAALIPDYRTLAFILLSSRVLGERVMGSLPDPEFTMLERMLEDAAAAEVPLIALKMPAPEPYQVDRGVIRTLSSAEVPLMSFWRAESFTPELFRDHEHLNEDGRELFTTLLAPALADEIRRIEPR